MVSYVCHNGGSISRLVVGPSSMLPKERDMQQNIIYKAFPKFKSFGEYHVISFHSAQEN
jgi:hypothetical protein